MKFATAAIGLVLAPLVSAQSYNYRAPYPAPTQLCTAAGDRIQFSSGYSAVNNGSCCPGLVSGTVAGEWGKICLAPGGDAPASKSCYKAGERHQGAYGFPAVKQMPCCEGTKSTTVYGQWGKFCIASGGQTPTTDKCYKTGERNQAASG